MWYRYSMQPQFPIYVCMLMHPQWWSTRRAIIWQEIPKFVSLLVRGERKYSFSLSFSRSLSTYTYISKYRCYTVLLTFYYAYTFRSLFAYFSCTNSNLVLSSMLAPPEHTSRISKTPFVNILVEFCESAVRVMEYVLSTIHLTIM